MYPTAKDALAESLKTLLEKKALDRITVKDVVENCGVTRQCFYYHFNDIYTLVEWIFLEEAKKAIAGKKDYDTWQQGFYQAFMAMLDKKVLVQNTFRSLGRDYLDRFMYDVLFDLVYEVVESQSVGIDVKTDNKRFIARFYTCAFIALGLDWIRTGMKEDPKDIIDQIAVLVKGDIRKAIEKYSQA